MRGPSLTRLMVEALDELGEGPALAQPYSQPWMTGCDHFVSARGATIPVRTLQGLSARGLARQLLQPSRFVLSAAGRQLAAALVQPSAA